VKVGNFMLGVINSGIGLLVDCIDAIVRLLLLCVVCPRVRDGGAVG
jgi:hypothetical protein